MNVLNGCLEVMVVQGNIGFKFSSK